MADIWDEIAFEGIIKDTTRDNVNDLIESIHVPNLELTKLIVAISLRRDDIVDYLISLGADITLADNYEQTPLMYAVQYNNYNTVLKLLQLGIDPSISMENSNGPVNILGYAFAFADMGVCDLLISYGADINFDDGTVYNTPLTTFLWYLNSDDQGDKLENMFKRGLNIERSPYPYLAEFLNSIIYGNISGDLELNIHTIQKYVRLFIDAGGYIEGDIAFEYSPIQYSSAQTEEGWDDISLMILRHGIILGSDEKLTLPGFMMFGRQRKSFQFLLEHKLIDINGTDYKIFGNPVHEDGLYYENVSLFFVAWHYFELYRDFTYIKLLLKHGANPNVQFIRDDTNNYDSLIDALKGEGTDIIVSLLQYGLDPNSLVYYGSRRLPLLEYYYVKKQIKPIILLLQNYGDKILNKEQYVDLTLNLSRSKSQREILRLLKDYI